MASAHALLKESIGRLESLPMKYAGMSIAIRDIDRVYTAQIEPAHKIVYWYDRLNNADPKEEHIVWSVYDALRALRKAVMACLGCCLTGSGFAGPMIVDALGCEFALVRVVVDLENYRLPVVFECKKIPAR